MKKGAEHFPDETMIPTENAEVSTTYLVDNLINYNSKYTSQNH